MPNPSSIEALPDDPVGNRTGATVVADALRKGIMRQTLIAGERLRQDAVATRFGVSQTIVREAFRQLAAQGFLKTEPRRGVSVAPLTADEAWEMTQLRSLIEGQVLEWAIPRMTKSDLDKANRSLLELDKAKSIDRLIDLNSRFHDALYAAAQKERTLELIANLRVSFERYLRFTWEETHRGAQSQTEHWELFERCKAGDVSGACSLLRSHILETGELLVLCLRPQDPSQSR